MTTQPHSEDMERTLLGSILLDADRAMYLCAEQGVYAGWFYIPWHAALFNVFADMAKAMRPIGLMTVTDYVRAKGLCEAIGGEQLLERLIDSTPTAAHAEYAIGELRDYYQRRTIYAVARAAAESAKAGDKPTSDTLAEILRAVVDMTSRQCRRTPESIANEICERWTNAAQGVLPGVPTPWRGVNRLIGGAQPGEMMMIAGRGGMGKSSLLATWAEYLGIKGIPLAYLPFEDGVSRTFRRIAGITGQFSVFHADQGLMPADRLAQAIEHVRQTVGRSIHMEDRPMTADQIAGWAMTMIARHGVRLVFVDAFKDVLRRGRDTESDDELATSLAMTSRRLNIPIVVCHHIRKGDNDAGAMRRLTIDDMRGSGSIKDCARQVLILQAENNGSDLSPNLSFSLEVAKTNFGPAGEVPMERVSKYTQWLEKQEDKCQPAA